MVCATLPHLYDAVAVFPSSPHPSSLPLAGGIKRAVGTFPIAKSPDPLLPAVGRSRPFAITGKRQWWYCSALTLDLFLTPERALENRVAARAAPLPPPPSLPIYAPYDSTWVVPIHTSTACRPPCH